MPSRRPLPPELGQVFTVRAALDAGVTPGRLRDGGLDRPFHGVRSRPLPVPGAPQATEPSAYDVQAQALRAANAADLYGDRQVLVMKQGLRASGR